MFAASPQYLSTRFILQAGICSGMGIASIVAARQTQSDLFTPFQVRYARLVPQSLSQFGDHVIPLSLGQHLTFWQPHKQNKACAIDLHLRAPVDVYLYLLPR